jgi:hypothetical protein
MKLDGMRFIRNLEDNIKLILKRYERLDRFKIIQDRISSKHSNKLPDFIKVE